MSNNTHGAEGQGCSRRLIVLEQREGVLKSTSVDLWHRMQMQCKGSGLSAVLLGPVDKENPSLQLSGPGVIHHACDERLRRYDPRLYRRIIGELFEEGGFSELLFADTALSRDLAPALSVRLGASLLSQCSALPEPGGAIAGSIRVRRREPSWPPLPVPLLLFPHPQFFFSRPRYSCRIYCRLPFLRQRMMIFLQ